MEEPSDASVIEASLTDPVAFAAVFDRHATSVRRYLVRRLGPDDSDDLLGEVFRIAFEGRAAYDLSRATARPWLYGIATNLLARHRRREGRRLRAVARLAGQHHASGDHAESVSGAIDACGRWERVAEAMAALPVPERDVLVLHVWEGLSYEEVALAVDVPVGTVRSRLNRARGRLRAQERATGRIEP